MSKEVRLGRKEQKRDRNAKRQQVFDHRKPETDRQRQTRKRHNAESKSRSSSVKDLFVIYQQCGVPGPAELLEMIQELVDNTRFDGIPVDQHAAAIFDPELEDLTTLPVGLLCSKEEALPKELLPTSRADLLALCRRMISRNQDEHLILTVLEGWPGEGLREQKLEHHVSDLWRLRFAESRLYEAILCGQHGEGIFALRHGRIPKGFSSDSLIQILVRHGLLYCTNGLQLNLARNAVAEKNPLNALISTDYTKLEPTRVANDLVPYTVLLKVLLGLYVTEAESDSDTPEPAEVPNDPIAKSLEASLRFDARQRHLDLMTLRPVLDQTVPFIKQLLAHPDASFLHGLERPISANELEKSFSAIWFSGLSNLQASAVSVLRYIQAEVELEQEIRRLVPQLGGPFEVREGTALPAFSPKRLNGWRNRAKDLLHAYRQAHLKDPDAKIGKVRKDKTGATAINKAKDFLIERGDRLIPDHEGSATSPRRTYYLLDVIPEHRLALQRNMVRRTESGDYVVVAKI